GRHCQTLVNLQWQEIDVGPLLERISVIERQIDDVRRGNSALQDISNQIDQQKQLVDQTDTALRKAEVAHEKTLEHKKEAEDKLDALQQDTSIVPMTDHQQTGRNERYILNSYDTQFYN